MMCTGFAYRECHARAIGQVWEGMPDGYWRAWPACAECWRTFCAHFQDLTDKPIAVEFLELRAPPPWWTRDKATEFLTHLLVRAQQQYTQDDEDAGGDDEDE